MTVIVTTDGDRTIIYNYDATGQFTNADIEIAGPDGSSQEELYNSNWQLTSATKSVVTDDGAQTTDTTSSYGPGWVMDGATITYTSDADPKDVTTANYDANWHLTSATVTTDVQSGQTDTVFINDYDGNWNLTSQEVSAVFTAPSGAFLATTNDYNASGVLQHGSAVWQVDGTSGSDSWTTGTHQISLTETANPGSATPLDKVVDVALDSGGHMTGAKIFTYGVQGQAFTQTEEDYDATWHLTSWHGQGPGYDQTVNYMV